MKTLIIYYSLEGNTKYIAENIAKELHAELMELKTKKIYPSKGFKKYIWGGKSVVLKEEPELLNTDIDFSSYNNIIIGTPIWAGTYAAPFNTFVNQYNITGKNIALFACHAGGGAKKCFNMFRQKLKNNYFVSEIDFIDPLKKNTEENLKKAIKWAELLSFHN
ncbi:flavodoxin family protein [Anaerovorax odorimutans]|uniref:flavodoxin family protein n=1 Tax=Anaerovorax odorimutans TaxID=109327 RepID=UPI000427C4A4|nr:flavodoxin [Anaerovorax odorimutans]